MEFKINLLRPRRGERLVREARVLKPRRTLVVVEAEVYGIEEKGNTLVSKVTVTMAALEQRLPEG